MMVSQASDTVIVTKLAGNVRSALQGSELMERLLDKGIIAQVLNIEIMGNTPTGKSSRNRQML